ncbi:hypothetical protein PV703_11330 [Streptomyces sp. ME01-24h]|nr:hypothetical protein [Streptomyces sp. ME01-24h]
MAERLTFTLTGRDELSRVLDGTGDSADRLRLRMAGITADSDRRLHDLQGNLLTTQEAQRRLDRTTGETRLRFTSLSDAADKLGERLKANLISLAPAAIPATAALAGAAAQVGAQLGAAAVAAGVYALAIAPQIKTIKEVAKAQGAYGDAVGKSGGASKEAIDAQIKYQQQLDSLPLATRKAAIAVGDLQAGFQKWSDSLAADTLGPFIKGVAVANTLLPKTTGLVKGASGQFDRLITLLGGAISTPGFDRLTDKFTAFTTSTLDRAVDGLTVFLAKLDTGEIGGGFQRFLDYARENGPAVWETLRNLGDALIHVLDAGSDVGVGMLQVINALAGIVSAVPPQAISTLLQLAIAIKAVRLAAVGADAARTALAALGVQVAAVRTAATGAPGAIGATSAAIGGLSRTAKVAMAGTGLGLLLITLSSLSEASNGPKADVDKLTTSLATLGQTGKVSGEALRVYGKDLGGLADALGTLAKPGNLDKTQQWLTRLVGMDSTPVKNAKEAFEGIDQALAGLVSGGKADLAAASLDEITAALAKQGFTAEQIDAQLDSYKAALAGQALEQKLAAESMGLFGTQAQETQAKLDAQKLSADGLRQSIQALNNVNRQGLGGMIGFEAAIDAAAEAAKKSGKVLDYRNGKLTLGTEKQRAAAQSLNDLAAKTDEATASARESGASWNEVRGIYERGREQLIKNAQAMGLNEDQAKALADQILKTPDKTAYLKGNLEDLQSKLADAKARLAKVPDSRKAAVRAEISDLQNKINQAKLALGKLKGKTVQIEAHVFVTGSAQARAAVSQSGHGRIFEFARGGLVGFPAGGPVRGPGTGTSDSILARVSNGEYVIPAARVQQYGLAMFDAIRAGKLGTALPAPRPGLAAAASGSSGQTAAVDVQVNFRDDRLRDLIEVVVTPKIRASEERQAFRATAGRRR